MTYFVINCSDGDVIVTSYEKEHLLKAIEDEYYGHGIEFMETLSESNPQYWGNQVLIIKGEVVTPRPKIVKYDI